jgi:hypothetical protein
MRLSRGEEAFLRHWIYDEAHYQDGPGAAKQLQLRHRVKPADLATLIAAALPDPAEQEAAGLGPPGTGVVEWPWPIESFEARMSEARAVLAEGACQ